MSDDEQGSGSGNADVTLSASQFGQLMDAISASRRDFETQLQQVWEDVRRTQDEAADKIARKVRREKSGAYVFRKKGNERQHQFNEEVEEKIGEALEKLDAITPSSSAGSSTTALDAAKAALKEGESLLARRQKVIKIADRSDLGWNVVTEYEADELADDSDDEKRLEKAERAAERKQSRRRKTAGGNARRADTAGVRNAGGRRTPGLQATPSSTAPPPAMQQLMSRPQAQTLQTLPQKTGPCFHCGQFGHLRKDCPRLGRPQGSQWYPPTFSLPPLGEAVQAPWSMVPEAGEGLEPIEVAPRTGDLQGMESLGDSLGVDWYAFNPMFCEEMEPAGAPEQERRVQGRLKQSIQFWEQELQAPESILHIIRDGYVLPLLSEPPAYCKLNQRSALADPEFVTQAVEELVMYGCAKRVPEPPHVSSPLSVVESSAGKKRLVLNLRHVNKYLWKCKFKYEDLRVALMLLEPGDFAFTFDLKSGYHHIDICASHQKYLGFQWAGNWYVFTVLPFGLAAACYMFTKLMRPLVKYWRALGLRIVVYLDDGICTARSKVEAAAASCRVRGTLLQSGFVANESKSRWDPRQQTSWLGFDLDLSRGCISVPATKIEGLKHQLAIARVKDVLHARAIASIVGKIISMSLALGPISRFMTRSLYAVLESRQYWCDRLLLTEASKQELQFWSSSLEDYNSQPLWQSPSAVRLVYSDASDTGYGGYLVEHGTCVAHGHWAVTEAGKSSTWRELVAVARVLEPIAHRLCGERVRWFTDNQNVVRILTVGSKKPELQQEAIHVFALAMRHQIRLEPEWIPRDENQFADYLSRIVDHDDWQINPLVFQMVDNLWGPHTVDRFASQYNAQLPRFNSRFACVGTEAIDAFTVSWEGECNWMCPPVCLVLRALRHAEKCRAKGTLIVPAWPSAPFWPLLQPRSGWFAPFVKAWCYLPLFEGLVLPGESGQPLFGGKMPNTEVLALWVDFSQ